MSGVEYKTMEYAYLTERMSDYNLGMLMDGINNRLVWNYGTSDFAFSRINKKYREEVDQYVRILDELIDEEGFDAEQDP